MNRVGALSRLERGGVEILLGGSEEDLERCVKHINVGGEEKVTQSLASVSSRGRMTHIIRSEKLPVGAMLQQ